MSDVAIGIPVHDEIYVSDVNDAPVTGLLQAGFGIVCIADGDPGTDTVVLTEVNASTRPGWYDVAYTPTAASGTDIVFHITHATYDLLGWRLDYHVTDAGAHIVTLTVLDTDTSLPIPSVDISVYNSGSTVKLVSGTTNASGQLVLHLDDGTYKVYSRKVGQYTFTNPATLTVSGTTALTIQGEEFSPSAPATEDLCVVYGWELGPDRVGVSVPVEASVVATNYFLKTNPHIVKGPLKTTSDEDYDGYWELSLSRSADFAGTTTVQYQFKINKVDMGTYTIPDQASVAFKDLVIP